MLWQLLWFAPGMQQYHMLAACLRDEMWKVATGRSLTDLALKVAVMPSHSPDAFFANPQKLLLLLAFASDTTGSADTVAAHLLCDL